VLFLDPYGMQVEWQTLQSVSSTAAIDLWLLFPLGIGVNRLLTKSGEIPSSWRRRLDILLGTKDWYDEFYEVAKHQGSLFGGSEEQVTKASTETIGRYFNDRLRSLFPGVASEPGVLRNSAGCPLYLLCFAAANEKGAPTALRIAEHLLRGLR
jgi:three-Cys-motif partner protein